MRCFLPPPLLLTWFLFLFLVDTDGSPILSLQQPGSSHEIHTLAEREYGSLFQLYRHLHANPELSFHEIKTAERIQRELESAGFEVTPSFGGHGVVGVLKNG